MTKIENRVYISTLIVSLIIGLLGGIAIGQWTLYKGHLFTGWSFTPVHTTIHAKAIEDEDAKTLFETLKIQTGIPDAYVTIHTEDQTDGTASQSEVTLKTDDKGILSYSYIPSIAENDTRSVRVFFTINGTDFVVDMTDNGMDVLEGDVQFVGAKSTHHTEWQADQQTTIVKCQGIPEAPAETPDQDIFTQAYAYIIPPESLTGFTVTIDGEATSHKCVGDGCLVFYYCKSNEKTDITIQQDDTSWIFADDGDTLSEMSGKMDIQQDVRVVTLLDTPQEETTKSDAQQPEEKPKPEKKDDPIPTAPMQKDETPTPDTPNATIAQGMPTGVEPLNPLTWVCQLLSGWR